MLKTFVAFAVIGYVFAFDSHTFLKDTRSDGGAVLDFTIPQEVDPENPNVLLSETALINAQVNALFAQIDEYTTHFNNETGPEALEIKEFVAEITRAKDDLEVITSRLENLQNTSTILKSTHQGFVNQLSCVAKSNCHPIPITTTLPPPPVYNCSVNSLSNTVSAANQTGQFEVRLRYEFDASCEFTLTSTKLTGLYFDFNVIDFVAYTSESTLTVDGIDGSNFTITKTGVYGNYTDWSYKIKPVGQLRFTIQYKTRDICDGFDCGGTNGHCVVNSGTNQPNCVCDGCYQLGPNNKCTIPKPSPCDTYGSVCTDTGGTCNADDSCQYYCVCPGVESCTTNKWCDGTCQTSDKLNAVQPKKKWWYWF